MKFKLHHKTRAFTLIEMMIVVMIIGLIMGIVGYNIYSRMDEAKESTVKTQIAQLENGIQFYKLKCGLAPSTEQGLAALLSSPTVGKPCKNYPKEAIWDVQKGLPQDPWGNDYQYASPGAKNSANFDIWSFGKDGEDGTEDDIGNWEEQEKKE